MKEDIHVGGQAVIEGVMMRRQNTVCIAVRKPNGKIKVKKEKIKSINEKYKWLKWPFFRGVINMYEMLAIGMRALTYSAEQQATKKEEKITKKESIISIIIAILLTILLFILVPLFLTKLLIKGQGILFNLVDGIIRIIIFISYIYLISRIRDVERIFQYHGAEHKAVNCYENNKKLTPENCNKYTTVHARCGTSFLLFVLIVSVLIFSLITHPNFFMKFFGRLLLLPVIVGISYELLKLSSRFRDNKVMKVIVWPGLFLQKITTKNPTKKQLEVAIAALKNVAG